MTTLIPLPTGWGKAWLHEAGDHVAPVGGVARSYDHLGRQLVWENPDVLGDTACDFESTLRDSRMIAARFQIPEAEFTRRWVVTEVLAKLTRTPILSWISRQGLAGEKSGERLGIETFVHESAGQRIVLAFGFCRPPTHQERS